MDPVSLKRVQLLVQPAAWGYHQALPESSQADLDMAFEEFGDAHLVAAYVLSVACEAAQKAAAVASGGQIKRLESGSEKIEYFQSANDLSADAGTWCARAQALRDQVSLERAGADVRTSTAVLDIATVF